MSGHFKYSWAIVAFWCLLISSVMASTGWSTEQTSNDTTFADVAVRGDRIEWHPRMAFEKLELTVLGPRDARYEREFQQGSLPSFQLLDSSGKRFPDGACTYQLEWMQIPGGNTPSKKLSAGRDENAQPRMKDNPEPVRVQTGSFLIAEGLIVSEEGSIEMESAVEEKTSLQTLNPDQCVYDNQVVSGSLCVGTDCVCPYESFGSDTIVLAENKLRILFDDTSSIAGYAANDWRISINDVSSGGADFFSIDDVSKGSSPFKVEAGAPSHSLYVDKYGRIGMGTSIPYVELHIVDGNTATVRLEQDWSGGYVSQRWDIAGNETNFFVRDVTNASQLPFRIQPDTPNNTLTMRNTGRVGVGTWEPGAKLHVDGTSDENEPLLLVSGHATATGAPLLLVQREVDEENKRTFFTVKDSGDVELFKTIGEGSDRNSKKNIEPVDTAIVLAGVVKMPVSRWNYKVDPDEVVHMGPMAQDFHAAFGVGQNDKHISSLDASGVSFAAIQELSKQLEMLKEMVLKQNEIIQTLQEEISLLRAAGKK